MNDNILQEPEMEQLSAQAKSTIEEKLLPRDDRIPNTPIVREIMSLAEGNDGPSMEYVGFRYIDGKDDFPVDYERGFYWLRKVEDKYPQSEYIASVWATLGWCYYYGQGTSQNMEMAKAEYQKSADTGWIFGLLGLARYYFFDAPENEREKCVPLLKKVCLQSEDADAETMLADVYLNKLFGYDNAAEGIRLLTLAYNQGDAEAARMLGNAYEKGNGVPQDYQKANQYWTDAVERGTDNLRVLRDAGLAWFNGDGVARDYSKARSCLERQHSPYGDYALGIMYFNGLGGYVDRAEGEKCLRRAIKCTDPELSILAMCNLGTLLIKIPGREAEAIKLFRQAAENGSDVALNNLGIAYFNGHGVEIDSEMAKHYFTLAAQQGNREAQDNLQALKQEVQQRPIEGVTPATFVTDGPGRQLVRKRNPIKGGIIGFLVGGLIAALINIATPARELQWLAVIIGTIIGVVRETGGTPADDNVQKPQYITGKTSHGTHNNLSAEEKAHLTPYLEKALAYESEKELVDYINSISSRMNGPSHGAEFSKAEEAVITHILKAPRGSLRDQVREYIK